MRASTKVVSWENQRCFMKKSRKGISEVDLPNKTELFLLKTTESPLTFWLKLSNHSYKALEKDRRSEGWKGSKGEQHSEVHIFESHTFKQQQGLWAAVSWVGHHLPKMQKEYTMYLNSLQTFSMFFNLILRFTLVRYIEK